MPDLYRRNFGAAGEERACAFLEEKGFSLVERNYRAGKTGEIDIIAVKENLVVFAEVKSRSSDRYGGGIYSINVSKKKHLKTAARAYLASHPLYDTGDYIFRFDLILVSGDKIEWVDDIIR